MATLRFTGGISVSAPSQGQGLIYNGSTWVPDNRVVSAGAAIRGEPNSSGSLSNGTDTGVNTDNGFWLPVAAKQIRLLYVNYYPDGNHGEDYSTTAEYTITAAVVTPNSTKTTSVMFGGRRTLTLDPGGFAFSDPIQVPIAANATSAAGLFRVRTFLQVSSGRWQTAPGLVNSGTVVETSQGGTSQSDLTLVGGVSGTYAYSYGPAAIYIDNLSPNTLRIYGLGDSIIGGSGDNVGISGGTPFGNGAPYTGHQGWFTRAFGIQNAIAQRAALTGDKAANYVGQGISGSQGMQVRIAALSRGANASVVALGTNDVGVGGQTLANLQAVLMPIWADIGGRDGMRAIYCHTLPPVGVTSTDNWTTTANQAVTANSGNTTIRPAYNFWLRDGAPMIGITPQAAGTTGTTISRCNYYGTTGSLAAAASGPAGHPLAGVFEFANICEVNSSNVLTPNGGYWIINGTSQYATIDGTHPSSVIHAAWAAAVPLAAIRAFVGVTG